jgi:putative membrane protein
MIGMMGAGMMGTANGGGNYGMMRSPDGSGNYGMMGSPDGGGNFGTSGAWSAGRNGMMNGGNGHDDGWSGWGIAMVVLMGLLIAAIVGGLVAWRLWKRTPTQTPLEILKTRYARGEIDEQEFERLRQALGK